MLKSNIFVISLEKAQERRQAVKANLESLNLDFEIIDAVYGKDLTEKELEVVSKEQSFDVNLSLGRKIHIDFEITKGEIGCALSHLNLYKKIIEDDLDYALILEDDCLLNENIKNLLGENGIEKSIDKWDVINLSEDNGLRTFCHKKLQVNDKYILDSVHFRNKYLDSLFNRRRFYIRTHAYFIKKEACKKLLDIAYPIRYPADFLLGSPCINNLHIYKCVPNDVIASIDTFESTLVKDENKRGSNFRLS